MINLFSVIPGFYLLSRWGWTCGETSSFMLYCCSLKFIVMFSSTLHVISEFWWRNGVCVWSFKSQLSCGPAIYSLMAGILYHILPQPDYFCPVISFPTHSLACGHLDWYGRGRLCPVLAVPSGFGDYAAKLSLLSIPIQVQSAPENGSCWLFWCEKSQHAHKIMNIMRIAKTIPDTGNNPRFFNIATHCKAEYLHKGKTSHNTKKKDPSCQWC